MTYDWSMALDLALLALGGTAMWLFIGLRWYRLHRAPRRRQVLSPLAGGTLVVVMILAGQIGSIIAAAAFGITLPLPADHVITLSEVAKLALGQYAAQGMVLMVYMHLLSQARRPLNDNRMKPAQAVAVGIGALMLFWPIVNAVGWLLSRAAAQWLGEPVDTMAHDTLALLSVSAADGWFWLMLGLVVVAAPVIEEVLYRGMLQETFGQLGMGHWPAIFLTSAIFALMHATVVPPWALIVLFVLSIGFGWAYEKTGRLAAPIVMHMLFNAGNVLLAMALT